MGVSPMIEPHPKRHLIMHLFARPLDHGRDARATEDGRLPPRHGRLAMPES
jgi:hypothetical protein